MQDVLKIALSKKNTPHRIQVEIEQVDIPTTLSPV